MGGGTGPGGSGPVGFTEEERELITQTLADLDSAEDSDQCLSLMPREYRFGPFTALRYPGCLELEFNLLGVFATAAFYKPNHLVANSGVEVGLLPLGVGTFMRWIPTPYVRLMLAVPGVSLVLGFLACLEDDDEVDGA
jgi:hypothetical protein